MPAKVLKKH